MRSNKCKSCGKEIYFLFTSKGNRMPVNAESLTEEEKEELNQGEPLMFIYNRHVSHFSDCPNSKKHRRTDNE